LPCDRGQDGGGGGFSDPSKIFEAFFGDAGFGGGGGESFSFGGGDPFGGMGGGGVGGSPTPPPLSHSPYLMNVICF